MQNLEKFVFNENEIKNDEGLKKEIVKFSLWLNEKEVFKLVEKNWNRLPKFVQWGILSAEEKTDSNLYVFSTLVEVGLLKYKGHKDEKEADEEIKNKNLWKNRKKSWGVKILSWFKPEIRKLLPVIEPILKMHEAKAEVLAEVRKELLELKGVQ